ncbi:NmrA family NAD(P)-binding protein [Nevskia soli]|uniref:NmrA family NAD(P)-binding protein n=1 Tax=Nevskia soli TaxID=418856 RepID=UPI001FE09153|nr:NmrA family NAD(P)-binding protein [Nevskia soli]
MTKALNVLITGATGDTGGFAVAQLLEKGHRVRALAHRKDDRSKKLEDLGAEVVVGDFLDFDAVRSAMEGMQRAYFCYPIIPGIIQATAYFAQAAKEVGVDGIVNMSQISARREAKSHSARNHWLAERVFDWSDVPNVAHIRPTYFAEWLLYMAPMIKQGVMQVPFSSGRHAPVAAEDQARVITEILENPAPHSGKIYPLYGPVEMTYEEISAEISRVIGKPIRFQSVSFDEFWEILGSASAYMPIAHVTRSMYGEFERKGQPRTGESYLAQHLRNVSIDHTNGVFAGTNDVIESIGGRPPTTVEAFVRANRQTFL